ncbi:MAG: alpha/beta fold hydrolase [Aureispira sp.]
MREELIYESIFIPLDTPQNDVLHVKRIVAASTKSKQEVSPTALLVHGVMESGRIFYSLNGKGLAVYLAQNGFDVFVPDLRGKGESSPKVNAQSDFGQTEYIVEDLPAIAQHIKTMKGHFPSHMVAHSWGGVLVLPFLLRRPAMRAAVQKMVFFGSKRRIRTKSLEKSLKIDLIWNYVGRGASKLLGYFPITKLGVGTEDESRLFMKECNQWVYRDEWIDRDQFDYQLEFQRLKKEQTYFPPTLHVAAVNDTVLGNPNDVQLLMQEVDNATDEYRLLSKAHNNAHDYGHNNMLTHKDAVKDHFPAILDWLVW